MIRFATFEMSSIFKNSDSFNLTYDELVEIVSKARKNDSSIRND